MTLETLRIHQHLSNAERHVRTRDVSLLSAATRHLRELVLGELGRYRARAIFPRNPDFAEPTPYFIDAAGTRCAMAHLLEFVGAHELVARVARTANNARVRELSNDPELLAWLSVMGLTVEDAARIQPSYCFYTPANCFCPSSGREASPDTVATGTVQSSASGVVHVKIGAVQRGTLVKVGDDVTAADARNVGDSVVVGVDSDGADAGVDGGAALVTELFPHPSVDSYSCAKVAANVSATEGANALMSTDCVGAIAAKNPDYGKSICEQTTAPADTQSSGCSIGASTDGALFFALSASLWVVRRRSRHRMR
jgi:hypothetical protein